MRRQPSGLPRLRELPHLHLLTTTSLTAREFHSVSWVFFARQGQYVVEEYSNTYSEGIMKDEEDERRRNNASIWSPTTPPPTHSAERAIPKAPSTQTPTAPNPKNVSNNQTHWLLTAQFCFVLIILNNSNYGNDAGRISVKSCTVLLARRRTLVTFLSLLMKKLWKRNCSKSAMKSLS